MDGAMEGAQAADGVAEERDATQEDLGPHQAAVRGCLAMALRTGSEEQGNGTFLARIGRRVSPSGPF